jgi:hypothetical protein
MTLPPSINGGCGFGKNKKPVDLPLTDELIAMLQKPFVAIQAEGCNKRGPAPGKNAAEEGYRREIVSRLVKYCLPILCKARGLDKSCDIAPSEVNVNWQTFEFKIAENFKRNGGAFYSDPVCDEGNIAELP